MTAPSPPPDRAASFDPRHFTSPRWLRRLAWSLLTVAVIASPWLILNAQSRLAFQHAISDCHARGEPILPADFPPSSLPDAENAATYFRRAADSVHLTPPDEKWLSRTFAFELPLAPDEISHLQPILQAFAPARPYIRQATQHPAAIWDDPVPADPVNQPMPHLQRMRDFCNVLRASALLAHQQGNDAAALAECHDMLTLHTDLAQEAPQISYLVAVGIGAAASDAIQLLSRDLHDSPGAREQSRVLLALLLDEHNLQQSIGRMWYIERARALISYRQFSANITKNPMIMVSAGSPQDITDAFSICRAADLSPDYPAAQAFLAAHPPAHAPGILTGLFVGSHLNRLIEMHFRSLTDQRFAALSLAVALYRADHANRFPPTLSALVPDYLPALPTDPFTSARSFHYQLQPAPLLYSVGTNLADDHADATLPRPTASPWEAKDYVLPLIPQPRPPSPTDD